MSFAIKSLIVISCILASSSNGVRACNLRHDLISFSSTITDLLFEFNLLNDKHLKGISSFHYRPSFKGARFVGGIYFSPSVLPKTHRGQILFDQSQNLKKTLSRPLQGWTSEEVTTSGLDPFESTLLGLKRLSPSLEGCSKKIKLLKNNLAARQKKLVKAIKDLGQSRTFLFFLGHFTLAGRPPKLLIHQDGFALFFLRHVLGTIYPGNGAYITWSEKKLRALQDNSKLTGRSVLSFGVSAKKKEIEWTRISSNKWNVTFPRALNPGLSQVAFIEALVRFASAKPMNSSAE